MTSKQTRTFHAIVWRSNPEVAGRRVNREAVDLTEAENLSDSFNFASGYQPAESFDVVSDVMPRIGYM